MSQKRRAKRAIRVNPREDRNIATNIVQFPTAKKQRRLALIPRNVAQEEYIDLLLDPTATIVVSTGPAGTGKTFLGTLAAIKALNAGEVDKIIITRPTRAVSGNDLGFLPGGIVEKMDPWVRPILDVFKEYYSAAEISTLIENNVLEFAPLSYMRGRTFSNAYIIADEMQNTTVDEMKMILTRIGENCRMVVDGDMKQSDVGRENGLTHFIALLSKNPSSNSIRLVQFSKENVIRSKVVAEVLNLFGE